MVGGWKIEYESKWEYKLVYLELNEGLSLRSMIAKLNVNSSSTKRSFNTFTFCFLSDEIGFSVSEALANSFIKWHFPLQCIAGFSLFIQSTFEI